MRVKCNEFKFSIFEIFSATKQLRIAISTKEIWNVQTENNYLGASNFFMLRYPKMVFSWLGGLKRVFHPFIKILPGSLVVSNVIPQATKTGMAHNSGTVPQDAGGVTFGSSSKTAWQRSCETISLAQVLQSGHSA